MNFRLSEFRAVFISGAFLVFAVDIFRFFEIWVKTDFDSAILYIKGLEVKGLFLFGGIQFLQIVFGIFPSEFVQISSMALFSIKTGFLICYIASVIGSIFIYIIVKKRK